MIIAVLLFLLVYTIYTSSIPLPDVVNHVDDHITVGFSQIETDNPWRTTQINSFREAFGPSNIDFIYHEPEEYTAKWQQEDITELIREKVDYLVIVPADLDALVPALQSAKEAGIPVILIEQSADTIDPDLYMSRISADYLWEGAICAQLLAEKYAGRSCNIVEIYGTESSPSAKARSKGFHQALKNYPQLHIIDTEYGNFDRVTAQKAMENALVKPVTPTKASRQFSLTATKTALVPFRQSKQPVCLPMTFLLYPSTGSRMCARRSLQGNI